MIDSSQFLSNLSRTCQKNVPIREDGKKLHFLNRLFDLFRGKKNSDHFLAVCKTLNNAFSEGHITAINRAQALNILVRLKEMNKEIQGTNQGTECSAYLADVEKGILKKRKVVQLADAIFADLSIKSDQVDRTLPKIEAILDYHGNDSALLNKIVKRWKQLPKNAAEPATSQKIVEMLLNKEEKSPEIAKNADEYLFLLKSHLETAFKAQSFEEVNRRLLTLKTLMENHSHETPFIKACLEAVDQFLSDAVFSDKNSKTIAEYTKKNLLSVKEIFYIADTFLPQISGTKLAMDLKVKCANLPAPYPRAFFPRLLLSETDQLEIVIEGLQQKENLQTDELCTFLQSNNPPVKHIGHLTTLLSSDSALTPENRTKLREVLKTRFKDQLSGNWDDFKKLKKNLEELFLLEPGSTGLVKTLKRTTKAKRFFGEQVGLEENMIMIPRWYHATHRLAIERIVNSGAIEVRHEKLYPGAWVSSQREASYGDYVLSLSGRVTSIDPNAFIGFQHPDRRWRGLQKPIEIKSEQEAPKLAFIGVPDNVDKMAKKADKLKMVRLLKEKGFLNPKALTISQLDFIQREIKDILGAPNLSDKWWGGGIFYSEHQLALREEIEQVPFDGALFHTREGPQNQLQIGQILQKIALPFYRQPMPQNPSYAYNTLGLRMGLTPSNFQFQSHLEALQKKEVPARKVYGTLHAARAALWTQVLMRAYEKLGQENKADPLLLATTGAFLDAAREAHGFDYWAGESAALLETLLKRTDITAEAISPYVQSVKEKNPKNKADATEIQRLLHDVDCLEKNRLTDASDFRKRDLHFYGFDKKQKKFCDQLIKEVIAFIKLTEKEPIPTDLEHKSDDFYGDLVRLLFKDKSRFPLLTSLIQDDMSEILKARPS